MAPYDIQDFQIWVILTLTFEDHPKKNLILQLGIQRMISINVNSSICPISAPLEYLSLRNLSALDCDLSRSPKVKCDCAKQSRVTYGVTQLFCEI